MDLFSFKNQRRSNLANKQKFSDKRKQRKINHHHKDDNPGSNSMINVYLDTKRYFHDHPIDIKEPTLYDINTLPLNSTILDSRPTYNTLCVIKNQDTFDMALDFIKEGYFKPLVLNMASEYKAGGGVASGKTAQEECLFRRSNAFQTHPDTWYPLEENEVIYSPEVQIIKDSNYNLLPQDIIDQGFVSMIAVAAIRKPRLHFNHYDDEDRALMTNKIESIFKIAILHGHDSLVLGALGCGVFKNPPEDVANIYKNCIRFYGKYFKKIGFAILCVKESDKENIDTFKKICL